MNLSHETFSALNAQCLGMMPMPAIKFFEPNERFVAWFKETFPRPYDHALYDVGAGLGHVSKVLKAAGFYPRAIDLNLRDGQEYKVEIADGTSYKYDAGSIVMLCRPCHGWFVNYTIAQAIKCHATYMIYVGLDKNLNQDLGELTWGFELVAENVGESGENIWIRKNIWPPDHNHAGMSFGGVKIAGIPKPHIRFYDDRRRKREVKAHTHFYSGVGGGEHYYTSLTEEDNPVWDADQYRWVSGMDDKKLKGKSFHERLGSLDEAKQWALKTFKKHFGRGRHKIKWDGGKEVWLAKYREPRFPLGISFFATEPLLEDEEND